MPPLPQPCSVFFLSLLIYKLASFNRFSSPVVSALHPSRPKPGVSHLSSRAASLLPAGLHCGGVRSLDSADTFLFTLMPTKSTEECAPDSPTPSSVPALPTQGQRTQLHHSDVHTVTHMNSGFWMRGRGRSGGWGVGGGWLVSTAAQVLFLHLRVLHGLLSTNDVSAPTCQLCTTLLWTVAGRAKTCKRCSLRSSVKAFCNKSNGIVGVSFSALTPKI